jgi:hypothetical protein
MSQLILTLDDALVQAAREYTRQRGQNLEALVTQFLQVTMQPAAAAPPAAEPSILLSPRIQRLFGAVQVPADFEYQKTLDEAMQERFGA